MGVRLGLVAKLAGMAALMGLLTGGLLGPSFGGAGVMAEDAAAQMSPAKLAEPPLPQVSTILAADGSRIASFYYENRTDVRFDRIAPLMRQAIVAIEDNRFYQHGALDTQGTMRALVRNQTSGGVVQGGSSLTQQYVKNVLFETAGTRVAVAQDQLRNAGTKSAKAQAKAALKDAQDAQNSTIAPKFSRKLQELRYALWVEQNYSKNEILAKYLNIAYFGHQTYGIEAAAQRYFSVHAAELTLPQAAMLAGMVNNANQYDPVAHPEVTLRRRDAVLDRMAQHRDITAAQATAAKAKPLKLRSKVPGGGCDGVRYAYFCSYVQNDILNNPTFGATADARRNLLDTGGLTIKTTLDPQAQDAAQRAVDSGSSRTSSKVTMEAMVKPGSGEIRAIAISRRFGLGKHLSAINYAADQAHGGGYGVQAGSTFKVFTLAAALADGYPVSQSYPTPTSMTISGFSTCGGDGRGTWTVANAEKSKSGSMDMATATWDSTNTYFAQLERSVGLCKVAKMAAAFGMTAPNGKPLAQVPAFTLGSNEIDIIHEAAAYAGFAASGRYCSPTAITGIAGPQGTQLNVPSAGCRQAVTPGVANQVNQLLRGVLSKGTAVGNTIPGRDAAGKTGTNENLVTAVFAGYTPNLAAVLWTGDPSAPYGDPVNKYGSSLAPLWVRSFQGALSGQPAPSFP
ncbi:MAG: Peptidoglycan glycosyltransferase [Streptosporangiaceae bacterium]|nr:Peptidoglycan glycosyltransferase [Streptosporangiaceae bacterium]